MIITFCNLMCFSIELEQKYKNIGTFNLDEETLIYVQNFE